VLSNLRGCESCATWNDGCEGAADLSGCANWQYEPGAAA
jgi:hypothetical protein